jgi:hypothetical protein
MKRWRSGRLLLTSFAACLLLVATATLPSAAATRPKAATQLQPTSSGTGTKSSTGRITQTDRSLLGQTSTKTAHVIVKLDFDGSASYAGGVAGLAATSPSVTGRQLSGNSADETRYSQYQARIEQEFAGALAAAVPAARITRSYRVVYGGAAVAVPANRIGDLLALPHVVAVQADAIRKPLTDSSTHFIGADTIWAHEGGQANAGHGVIFGSLDTGIWPEHPSFNDDGSFTTPPPRADGKKRKCDFGDDPLTPAADVFQCNDKLIGGQPFIDTYNAVIGGEVYPDSARDSNGHGTHTSSTSAGDIVPHAVLLGVDRGQISGLAPGAWVMGYKVCGLEGCFGSDSMAAVEQAILDGVNVINFSISGGTDPAHDPVELAFLDAYAAGVFVAASAGNEGPGPNTVNHISPWVTSVAASTQARKWQKSITLYGGGTPDTVTIDGTGVVPDTIDDQTLVTLAADAPGYGVADCSTPAAPGTFTDQIVACLRSPNRVVKGLNVLAGGAVGMLLYNGPGDFFPEMSDSHFLPTVHTADGQTVLDFLANHAYTFATMGGTSSASAQGDVMAGFSSRGPGGLFVKPDITAPGVQILAGNTPTPDEPASGPPGQYFQSIGGTSMSSPHIAGSAILLKAMHPTWTPSMLKSAMMTSSLTSVVKENGTTPADPFDDGAGRVDLHVAGRPNIVFDENAIDMATVGLDPLHAIDLNMPSINAPAMPGQVTTHRTVRDVSGHRRSYTVTATADGGSIAVSPKSFTLPANGTQVLTITINSTKPGQHFGSIVLDTTGTDAHIPVAFFSSQGSVSLTSKCTPKAVPVNTPSACTVTAQNNSFSDALVDLTTTAPDGVKFSKVTAPAVFSAPGVAHAFGTLSGKTAGDPTIAPGESPGFFSLPSLGVTPLALGDETLINFDVPPYVYGGLTYDTLGVTSDGYLVVGDADQTDVQCCPPQVLPDPARPNNVLAPFWTDLDGTGNDGVYAAILTDGVSDWIAIEWHEFIYGTSTDEVFQAWIGVNGVEDISFAYDPANLPTPPPPAFGLTVGAENATGTAGDMIAGAPTENLRVTSVGGQEGGAITYTITAGPLTAGTFKINTAMGASSVPGTTIVIAKLIGTS